MTTPNLRQPILAQTNQNGPAENESKETLIVEQQEAKDQELARLRATVDLIRAVFIDNASAPAWEQTRQIEAILEDGGFA